MSSKNKKPQILDLSALLKGLNEAGVEFIVVGGMAAVVQGAPITTFDLGIVHRQTDENIKKLMKFLKSIDAYLRRPDDKLIEPDERDFYSEGHVLLTTCIGPLDVLAVIEKNLGFDDLLPNSVKIEFQGHKVYVLNLETIVALKRESKDPKDQYRLPILEETLHQIIEENND
jgi:predicted nucleotidyltransferase